MIIKPEPKAPPKNKTPNNTVLHLRELAWTGQHAQVIDLATQELAMLGKGGSRTASLQMDLLDLRAESNIAQGKFDLAAKDAAAMVKFANAPFKVELTSDRRRALDGRSGGRTQNLHECAEVRRRTGGVG